VATPESVYFGQGYRYYLSLKVKTRAQAGVEGNNQEKEVAVLDVADSYL
jgi:hypothetical protein